MHHGKACHASRYVLPSSAPSLFKMVRPSHQNKSILKHIASHIISMCNQRQCLRALELPGGGGDDDTSGGDLEGGRVPASTGGGNNAWEGAGRTIGGLPDGYIRVRRYVKARTSRQHIAILRMKFVTGVTVHAFQQSAISRLWTSVQS